MKTLEMNNNKNIIKNIVSHLDGQKLYLIAWTVFLTGNTLTTTMFQVPGMLLTLCNLLPVLLILAKILLYDHFTAVEFWGLGVVLLIGILIAVKSGYKEPLLWLIMLVGAKDVPFQKILQVYVIIVVSIVIMAFCASMLEVIENLQYKVVETGKIRNSFGAMYTTDFASHIFSSVLSIFYLLKNRIKMWHYITVIVISALVFAFCNTRLDVGCIIILLVAFLCLNIWEKKYSVVKKYQPYTRTCKKIKWFMPAMMLLMFATTILYSPKNPILSTLDDILSTRLKLGKQGLSEYGMTLFGQQVDMVGNGGSTIRLKEYFFVDCSYIYIFLRYGLIFLLITLAVYMLCCKKYENDPYFLVAIVLVSINCMIAHHIVELTYCPFALAVFSAKDQVYGKKYCFSGRRE